MERNILLTIEYDGTEFSGWQRQPNAPTIQGDLEKALSAVCGCPIQINGTSRTDAGVHAYGQRASFLGDFGIPTDKLPGAVNNRLSAAMRDRTMCGPIRIVKAEEKPLDFHARFDAKGKKYSYRIRNTQTADLFQRNYCYHIKEPLDIAAMAAAAAFIKGTHDFACFQAAGGQEKETTVRTIYDLQIFSLNEDVIIEVKGDGFLYNMVRIITGTLVEAGQGKILPQYVESVVKSKDRRNAGHTAPPQGLYLAEVYYEALEESK